MTDWIHCNMCFVQPRGADSNFVLTSCGHVFCMTCENRETVDECKICKTPCSIIKLRGDVLPNVKEYFEEPLVIAEKLVKTIRFQKGHRANLFKAYSKNGEKYLKAKAHIQKLESHLRRTETYIRKLEKKLDYYEKHASPASTVESFHFTPYMNNESETQSQFFSSAKNKKTTIDTPRFLRPENVSASVSAFKQYRYEADFTPATASPSAEATPRSTADYRLARNSTSSQRTPARSQAKFPTRTPPYTALNNLKITGNRK